MKSELTYYNPNLRDIINFSIIQLNSKMMLASRRKVGARTDSDDGLTTDCVITSEEENIPRGCPLTMKSSICRLTVRGVVLFLIGAAFTLLVQMLQYQKHNPTSLHSSYLFSQIFRSLCWLIPLCGIAAVLVGLLFPCMDEMLGCPHKFTREWSSVMRCTALYVGINHVTTKLDFHSDTQLVLALCAMSVALWYLFDRSGSGLGLGVTVAVLAAGGLEILILTGACRFPEKELLYLFLCIPCVFFCGGITIGNIGRQLAMIDYLEEEKMEHKKKTS